MTENFPDLAQETDVQIQEAQRVPNKMNPKRPTPRHAVVKMTKVRETILRKAREKQVTYKANPIGSQLIPHLQLYSQKGVAGYI